MDNKLNITQNEKTVFIFNADEGMILSRDVNLPDGHLIAAKYTVLNLNLITKISNYHILEVSIYDNSILEPSTNEENITYYNKIR
jgi:hypothetical protein